MAVHDWEYQQGKDKLLGSPQNVFAETMGGNHPRNCLIVLIISDIERQPTAFPVEGGLLRLQKYKKKHKQKNISGNK